MSDNCCASICVMKDKTLSSCLKMDTTAKKPPKVPTLMNMQHYLQPDLQKDAM